MYVLWINVVFPSSLLSSLCRFLCRNLSHVSQQQLHDNMRSALLMVVALVTVSHRPSQALDISLDHFSCVNHNETTNTSLTIDCEGLTVDSRDLSRQLDSLLADDELREGLTSLTIINTPLRQVPVSVCGLSSLLVLILDHNRLTRLPDDCFTNMPDLHTLSANHNNITALQDGLFHGLRNLSSISFNWNQISTIGRAVFTEKSDLNNLTLVSLSNNLLTTLEPWPAILGVARSPHKPLTVSVRHNRIATLSNTVGWHYKCTMPPTYFYVNFHRNLLTHLTDMLAGWGLALKEYICLVRYKLKGGDFPSTRFDIGHNPFICDCRDFFFYKFQAKFVYTNLFDGVYCDEPAELYTKQILRIQLIEYTCDLDDGCPSGCKCSFRPANATVHVSCPSNFSSLPLRLPPLPKSYARYKLELPNSKLLRRLDYRPYLDVTSFLDVSHSSVEEIGFDAWKSLVNIREVYLNNNLMTKVPREYSEVDINSSSISLERNLWDCSCGRSWMHDWFNAASAHIRNPTGILCESPPRLRGTSIMKMNKEQFCVDPVQRAVTMSLLAVFGGVGLLIALAVAVYCLRVWVHSRWKFHPFDRDECRGENMDYDMFLSCSSEDRDTHGRRVLDLVESKGYRVFRPGADTTDDVTAAVQRSRRTVCLLSKHFIKRFATVRHIVIALLYYYCAM